jgi:transcriptional regulator with XRE-family HTH domain
MAKRGQSKIEQGFGIAVRRRRHRLKISQEEFAEKADIHRTYVSSIELGKVDLGLKVAQKTAEALGVSLSILIREAEKEL